MLDPHCGAERVGPTRCQGGDLAGPGCGCLAPGGEAADRAYRPSPPVCATILAHRGASWCQETLEGECRRVRKGCLGVPFSDQGI